MKTNELIKRWKAEEEIAHIHGWDFSHIEGRYMEEDDLPWDYREEILRYLKPEMRILDIDTGGGEFLLSLNHPNENTAATENYPPNVDLCQETLLPLGIDFRAADGKGMLPFEDASFEEYKQLSTSYQLLATSIFKKNVIYSKMHEAFVNNEEELEEIEEQEPLDIELDFENVEYDEQEEDEDEGVSEEEFEEMFPYEETEDQLTAIEETKRDMESDRIMDRLICGDVGFGKTEIAIRAAFKAVQENKQVVYLVPTTVLAQQHYNTFL